MTGFIESWDHGTLWGMPIEHYEQLRAKHGKLALLTLVAQKYISYQMSPVHTIKMRHLLSPLLEKTKKFGA